jgi:hypothetical protein
MRYSAPVFFTLIKPIWIGDLGTRTKIKHWDGLGLLLPFITRDFCFSAVAYSAKKYKMAISGPNHPKYFFLAEFLSHLDLCKKPDAEYLMLGPL